jgi:hypothetical protein
MITDSAWISCVSLTKTSWECWNLPAMPYLYVRSESTSLFFVCTPGPWIHRHKPGKFSNVIRYR